MSKITVGLYVRGLDLDPDKVTAALSVEPTIARAKGDVRELPSAQEIVAKEGLWVLREYSEDKDVGYQLSSVAGKIPSARQSLTIVPGIEDVYIDVFIVPIGPEIRGGEYSFELNKDDIEFVARLGLPVRFTVVSR